jgi:hypothetical protein
LDVRVVEDIAESVTVHIAYDSPFYEGDIRVMAKKDDRMRQRTVEGSPKRAKIHMGTGEITFRLKASHGETDWILAGLSLDDPRLLRYEPWRLLKTFRSGEYDFFLAPKEGAGQRQDLLAVWSLVKYHKNWKSNYSL